jgi:nucleoside-diphosphate-sugar epimerase
VTRYGRSKLEGELVLPQIPIPWTIVRPGAVYGPRDRELLRAFRAAALGIVPVFGDGSQELSLIFAPDLAEALVATTSTSDTIGRTFAVCHPEIVTTRSLASRLGEATGKRPRIIGVPRPVANAILGLSQLGAQVTRRATLLSLDKAAEFFAAAWTADPAPFTAATGWRAGTDLATGAVKTVEWYREAGWI